MKSCRINLYLDLPLQASGCIGRGYALNTFKGGLDLSFAKLPELGRPHGSREGHKQDGHLLGIEGNNQRLRCLVWQELPDKINIVSDILFRFIQVDAPLEFSQDQRSTQLGHASNVLYVFY